MCTACARTVNRHSSTVSASPPRYCEIGRLVSRLDSGPDLDPGRCCPVLTLNAAPALTFTAYPHPLPSPQVGVRGLHPGPAAERARPAERWRRREMMYISAWVPADTVRLLKPPYRPSSALCPTPCDLSSSATTTRLPRSGTRRCDVVIGGKLENPTAVRASR